MLAGLPCLIKELPIVLKLSLSLFLLVKDNAKLVFYLRKSFSEPLVLKFRLFVITDRGNLGEIKAVRNCLPVLMLDLSFLKKKALLCSSVFFLNVLGIFLKSF